MQRVALRLCVKATLEVVIPVELKAHENVECGHESLLTPYPAFTPRRLNSSATES